MSGKKVAVAMSGGVDSSVAALLLKQAGYEVIGITMQIWSRVDHDGRACGSLSAIDDAQRVAGHLNLAHYVVDFRDEFEEKVVDYFCQEYRRGRTPNPCIRCNRCIKFGLLREKARALGAEYLATGHYARIQKDSVSGLYRLVTAVDENKDQTYFLYRLNQQQLGQTLFPLGSYHKAEVRLMAEEAGLPVAEKPESQEICFIPGGRYSDFVGERLGVGGVSGSFRYADGTYLGPHRGIHCYTIGQRKGLGLALGHPVFVTGIDAETGTVWVGEEEELHKTSLLAVDVSYVSGFSPADPQRVRAKIRYGSPAVEAVVTPLSDDQARVDFAVLQRAITPGQAVVWYERDAVLGGGTILQAVDE
ncbi:MAG: tRNA 2-thiouridine(34) synthase MnmA [Syntrophomonadaceae bacterium]|jgi:tRNA-specific 2-thiouridylase|nr:tRNA 2-thiouridine(34) synthase MnmA [Syntrophomonadaceae bacterium]